MTEEENRNLSNTLIILAGLLMMVSFQKDWTISVIFLCISIWAGGLRRYNFQAWFGLGGLSSMLANSLLG